MSIKPCVHTNKISECLAKNSFQNYKNSPTNLSEQKIFIYQPKSLTQNKISKLLHPINSLHDNAAFTTTKSIL